MKTIVIFAFLYPAILLSQDFDAGISVGVNFGMPYSVAEDGSGYSLGAGPALGLYYKKRIDDKWHMQLELLFSKKNSVFQTPIGGDTLYEKQGSNTPIKTTYNGWMDGHFSNSYLDFPILFVYRTNPRWSFMIGPRISYLLKGENKGTLDVEVGPPDNPISSAKNLTFDISNRIKTWDYAICLGGAYNFNEKIELQLGVSYGLFSIYKSHYKYINEKVRNIYVRAALRYHIDFSN